MAIQIIKRKKYRGKIFVFFEEKNQSKKKGEYVMKKYIDRFDVSISLMILHSWFSTIDITYNKTEEDYCFDNECENDLCHSTFIDIIPHLQKSVILLNLSNFFYYFSNVIYTKFLYKLIIKLFFIILLLCGFKFTTKRGHIKNEFWFFLSFFYI